MNESLDDDSREHLARLIEAFTLKAESAVRVLAADYRVMYARLTQDEKRLLATWANISFFRQDPSFIRADIAIDAKFSAPSDDDQPRARSMTVVKDENAVQFSIELPLWLDEFLE